MLSLAARRVVGCLVGGALVCLAISRLALADPPTTTERTLVRSADAELKRAGNLYRSKKYSEAAEAIKNAQQSLDQLADGESAELTALAAPVRKQLARARELLEAKGIELPEGKAHDDGSKQPAVSFTKQVAPILVARCAACHIQRSRGGLNMSTYVSLAKGSDNGPVIVGGDAETSRMIELLKSGDMPRAGGKLADDQLALITAWIAAGAKFDGADSAAPLASYAAAASAPQAPPTPGVVMATGKESVLFSRDIASTLATNCLACHGDEDARKNFSLATFGRLLQGGESGPPIVPGKPRESLLVKKLRGMAGPRMPFEKPPLTEETIAKIERWIALGAKFDGPSPTAQLEQIAAGGAASSATHDELSRTRSQLAASNWRLFLPDVKPNQYETPQVLVYGSLSREILADVAQVADQQAARLQKLFKVPADEPLIKGRATLFAFDKRYDYGEVGAMLEHREIPSTCRGHWRRDGADAYACVLLTSDATAAPGLVAQQLAGLYLSGLGQIPRWYAEGTARAIAARVEPKDPRVKLWDDQVPRILSSNGKPAAFLTEGLPPEDNDILSYSYCRFLLTNANRHAALVAALQQKEPFDAAFSKAYGAPPADLVDPWLTRATKRVR